MSPTPDETYDAAVTAAVPASRPALRCSSPCSLPLHLVMLAAPCGSSWRPSPRERPRSRRLRLAVHRRPLPDHLAQPATAGLVLVAAANAMVHMVAQREPRQTTNVMLVVVGAGRCAAVAALAGRDPVPGLGRLGASAPSWSGPAARGRTTSSACARATLLAAARQPPAAGQRPRRSPRRSAAAEAAAVRDHLTGLANRRGLAMVGAQMVEQARRQGDAVHCIFVDIDGLKRVNDALGHAVGDEVIVAVAEALRAATRATDVVARWGGDEFCVVGPGPGMAPLELERRVRGRCGARLRGPGRGVAGAGSAPAARCSRPGTPAPWRRCSARPTRRCTCAARCAEESSRAAAAAEAGRVADSRADPGA